MKIAFIHDWLTGMRGGEKVLEAACELYPEAEIHTLIHDAERVSAFINSKKIHASWLDSLPGARRRYRWLLPLMPLAIRSFDLRGFDLILSFSHCVAKGAAIPEVAGRRPLHICYCFTPMRYAYEQFEDYFADSSRSLLKLGARLMRPSLRRWDKRTSKDVAHFVADSENVRRRIERAYGREAAVIYPPVNTDFFTPRQGTDKPAGALVPYKRVDLAIIACRRLGVRLKIVGIGTEERRLRSLAEGAPVEFLGWRSDEGLRELYRGCQALLFPQNEDFGITAVEAQACGRPVVAFRKGGALETVRDGETGVFFAEQTAEALAEAIGRAGRFQVDPAALRAHALRFSRNAFKSQLSAFVRDAWEKRAGQAAPAK